MRGNQVREGIGSAAPYGGKLRLFALPFLILTCLALSAVPAHGALTHPLKKTFGPFGIPSSVAIDGANGNVFVADALEAKPRIKIFGPEGEAPTGVKVSEIVVPPPPSGSGLSGRVGVAIDNSATSPAKGTLYVTDRGNDAVAKFVLNPLSEEYEPKGSLSATPSFQEPLAMAVDAKGNVFVGEYGLSSPPGSPHYIVELSPAGTEIARFDITSTVFQAYALALDSAGNLYAQGNGVWKLAANGSGEIEPGTTPTRIIAQGSTGIAIDQSTDPDTPYAALGRRVAQYSTDCVPVSTPLGLECKPELEFGVGILELTRGIAVSPLNGDIYVADTGEGKKNVAIFDAGFAIVPDAISKATTQVTETSATLNGVVSAAEGPSASCEFQYTSEAEFKVKGFEGATSVPCPTGPFTGSSENAVEVEISGLSAQTTYLYRLVAENEKGPSFGEALSFQTVGLPKVNASEISHVTLDSATVEGLVNPNGGPGAAVEPTYAVQYVSEEDFDASEYDNATEVPLGGAALGSGTKDVKVEQSLSGLNPFTTYHFRILAENEAGETIGPDKTFTTYIEGATGLPDGRAYEQATAIDKGGANPRGATNFVMAGSGEGGITGITFVTTGGAPGSEGSQRFPTFLARRAADGSGWATQGLLPPASKGAEAVVRGYSEDFSQTYVTQGEPGSRGTFYERDAATLQMRPMVGGVSDGARDNYAGASADGSKVLLETLDKPPLPSGAAEGKNTYVWDKPGATAYLAGVLNDEQAPSGGTSPGSYAGKGGGKYTLYENAISDDGSRVFFSSNETRQLYLRLNPTQPQSAMAGSECTEAELACTVHLSASQRIVAPLKDEKPSTFWLATPDGAVTFFTSSGKLTNDAKTGPKDEGSDLYRYEVESGQLTDLTVDSKPSDPKGADVQGVVGASNDGSYVYFVANGLLTTVANAEGQSAVAGDCEASNDEASQSTTGHCNLYLWHEGEISFIAPQHATVGAAPRSDATNWLRGPAPGLGEKTARVTPNGLTLLFVSQEKLTAYDNKGTNQLYRYSALSGGLACISCNPTGAAPVASAGVQGISTGITDSTPASTQTRNLSADGNRVFFESPDRLVIGDTNGEDGCPLVSQGIFSNGAFTCLDVYEWEANGTGSCESEDQNGGCLYLLSTGTSSEASFFGDASLSGDDAYIFTSQPLVAQDKDELVDIYDARVGGGIAAQNALPKPICEGEACKPGVPAPPATQSPGSSSFSGPGNQKPAHHKKKKRRQGKKKHKRKHQEKRLAARKHR